MKSKSKCLYLSKCKIVGACTSSDYKNKRPDFIKIDCFFNIEKKKIKFKMNAMNYNELKLVQQN